MNYEHFLAVSRPLSGYSRRLHTTVHASLFSDIDHECELRHTCVCFLGLLRNKRVLNLTLYKYWPIVVILIISKWLGSSSQRKIPVRRKMFKISTTFIRQPLHVIYSSYTNSWKDHFWDDTEQVNIDTKSLLKSWH